MTYFKIHAAESRPFEKDKANYCLNSCNSVGNSNISRFYWLARERHAHEWTATFGIIWILTTLQLCHIFFGGWAHTPLDTGVGKIFFSVTQFVTEFPCSETTAYVISMILVYFFLLFSVFCVVTKNHFQWVALMRLEGWLLTWLPTVLFVPVVLPHAKMIVPCMHYANGMHVLVPHFPTLTCWQGTHIALSALSLVTLAMWVPLCYLVNLICYNADTPTKAQYRDNALNARFNNRPEAYMVLVKAVLFTLLVAGVDSSWRYATSVIVALAGAAMVVCQLYYLPWWRDEAQTLYILQAMMIGWTGTAAFLLATLEDSAGITTLYFLGMPMIGLFSAMALTWRLQSLNERAACELDSAWLFQLKARNALRGHQAYLHTLGDIYVEDTPALVQRRQELLSTLTHIYEVGLKRFPTDASLHASLAAFHTYIDRNRVLAYRAIHAAELLQPSFDCGYQLYCAREDLLGATKERCGCLFGGAREPLAREATAQAARALVHFWSELLHESPDVDQVSAVGQTAREELSRAVAHYERLLVLNPRSEAILRAYAMLCMEVTGDHSTAMRLLQHAEQVETSERGSHMAFEEKDIAFGQFLREVKVIKADIFDEINGVLSISVAPESLGLITATNTALARMLGYHKTTDLVGRNVKMLVPEPIASVHDQLIGNYLVSQRSHVVNHVRMVTAVHHQGHLCPFFMHLRWEDEAQGRMVAVMQPIHNSTEACAIVDVDTRIIEYATLNITELLGFSRRDVLSRRVGLASMIPAMTVEEGEDAERALKELFSESGHQYFMRHQITGVQLHVQAYAQMHVVQGQYFYFLRCTATTLGRSQEAEADAKLHISTRKSTALSHLSTSAGVEATDSTAVTQGGNRSVSLFLDMEVMDQATGDTKSDAVTPAPQSSANDQGVAEKLALDTHQAITTAHENMKQRRRRREMRTRRQLLQAIANDATTTMRKLEWMRVFSVLLVAFICALATVLFIIGQDRVELATSSIRKASLASLREAYMTEILFQFRFIQMFIRLDPAPALLSFFYRPAAMQENDKAHIIEGTYALINRAQQALDSLTIIDRDSASSSALQRLLSTESLELFTMGHDRVKLARYSLLEATSQFSAYVRHSIYMNYATDAEDPGFFFALSNGVLRLREALQLNAALLRVQIEDYHDDLLVTILVMCGVSIACVLLIFAGLVMPLVARVERSSDRVLAIFLAIPLRTRRALRRRAHRVYALARRDDELLASVSRDEERDQEPQDSGIECLSLSSRLTDATHFDAVSSASRRSRHKDRVGSVPSSRYNDRSPLRGEVSVEGKLQAASMSSTVVDVDELQSSTLPHGVPKEREAKKAVEVSTRARTLLSRNSVHNLALRFLLYFLVVVAYYTALILHTQTQTTAIGHVAHVATIAGKRAPAIQMAFFFSTQHVLFNQTEVLAQTPFDGSAYAGDYKTTGIANLNAAEKASSLMEYGSAREGVARIVQSDELTHLMYGNICAMDPQQLESHVNMYTVAYGHIFEDCEAHFGGLLTKGLAQAITYVVSSVHTVLDAPAKAVAHMFFGGAPATNLSPTYLMAMMNQWTQANNLFHDYVSPLLLLASVLYREQVTNMYHDYNSMTLLLFGVFLAANAVAYVILFHRSAHMLANASTKTKNAMLLLPPEIIRFSTAAQAYIDENISSI